MEARAAGAALGGKPTTATIDSFTSLTGWRPAMVEWFQNWASSYDRAPVDACHARGATPILTWLPRNPARSDRDYKLTNVARGDFDDTYLRPFARAVKAHGKPVLIRLAHEMNGDWKTPWSYGPPNENRGSDYVAFWQRVTEIFDAEGASNVRWFWCPAMSAFERDPAKFDFGLAYPGDEHVDVVGVDGYNWGKTRSFSRWRSFTDTFDQSYDHIRSFAPDKPFVIGETGSTEVGGDKAAWMRSAYLHEIPERFPDIAGVIWFNERKETDWRVNSSARSLAVYREVVAHSDWQGAMP